MSGYNIDPDDPLAIFGWDVLGRDLAVSSGSTRPQPKRMQKREELDAGYVVRHDSDRSKLIDSNDGVKTITTSDPTNRRSVVQRASGTGSIFGHLQGPHYITVLNGTFSLLSCPHVPCESERMRKLARHTEVLAVVETAMPDASLEEKLEAGFELWRFFDAIWTVADRLVTEEERARATRDKSAPSDSLESSPHA